MEMYSVSYEVGGIVWCNAAMNFLLQLN